MMDLSKSDNGSLEDGKEEEDGNEEEEDVDFNPFLVAEVHSEASSSLSSEEDDTLRDLVHEKVNSNVESDHDSACGSHGKKRIREPSVRTDYFNDGGDGRAVDLELLDLERKMRDGCNQFMELDAEDAICKRTRARHSLVDCTLEELETFLQDSDDDDVYASTVNDQEAYRKFIASLSAEGDDGKLGQEEADADEDEDNDLDFEIEIQEALESDGEEVIEFNEQFLGIPERDSHRPETRPKRHQRNQKEFVGMPKVPLRPILPFIPNDQASSYFPQFGNHSLYPNNFPGCSSIFPSSGVDTAYGFTAQQIGQLHCLIHEHVQLLIQIFSLCILDHSRQHIANDVQKMILEIDDKKTEALARRKIPYPVYCFNNFHLHQSEYFNKNQLSDGAAWLPSVKNPILSILDVATLAMVREYMADVSDAVLKHRGSQLETAEDKSHMKKEPLFPVCNCSSVGDRSNEATCSIVSFQNANLFSSSQVKPKKSLAAALVEDTKKRSIALVPKSIADLAHRFVPFFNSTLFPHKPPPPSVANRVLFTESEDRLLAMGLMECNTDWVAIQQRLLPCKSKHQIFVRQKNRSSSKSPENPIKTVRHMKTSPLTADEVALVSKGLKIFKNDWAAIWRFFVPYRDPSLLHRQWRMATGTQKSYRKSETVKMKRREYEAKRRILKASLTGQHSFSEKVDTLGISKLHRVDEDNATYVHEAFVAEEEPGSSKMIQPVTSQERLPYEVNKASAIKVVKLAPGLPPVNLPPSVRVISQSAFKKQYVTSSSSNIADKACHHPQKSSNAEKNSSTLMNLGAPENINSSKVDHHSTEENCLGSDIRMHPLLFGASENLYQSDHRSISTEAALKGSNFLSGYSIMDSCNFCQPRYHDGTTLPPCQTGNSKRLLLSLQSFGLNPLKRNETRHGDTENDSRDNSAVGSLHTNCALTLYDSCSNVDVNHLMLCNTASTSHREKENELDLDMNLAATNKGRKGSSDVIACKGVESRNSSALGDTMALRNSCTQNCQNAVISNHSPLCSMQHNVQTSHNPIAYDDCVLTDKGNTMDVQLTGIVMEKEELSDSDEESEHIEFEREEMDDSEEEI